MFSELSRQLKQEIQIQYYGSIIQICFHIKKMQVLQKWSG